jgi:hypothetical protein
MVDQLAISPNANNVPQSGSLDTSICRWLASMVSRFHRTGNKGLQKKNRIINAIE